ncbi:MAG TPA: class I tRNA ligase family protein, partial [Actinomycetota bacterium]|nr:class I tRNA ligase family protein [Actinomycetota bacterium]
QIEEDNYFFRLSRYRERLIELYETNPRFIMPESRRKEIVGKVKQGLDDLSMSRVSFDWGIPIPWDEKHVIYVWVDALQNYITAVGYGDDRATFDRVWPADVHLVGKDILWFHSVIWPAMLMALDLPLPETVFAHGWLQVGGEKMSKSKLTGISPHDLVATFGSDGYRYFFAREVSFGLDGNFSWEAMVARYNADLANDFGNLVSRVTSMITRYLGGVLPEPPGPDEYTESEHRLIDVQRRSFEQMERYVNDIAPHEALKSCWAFVRKANSYVEEVTPWSLSKDDSDARRLEVVLYMLADALRLLALMTAPIAPRAAQELWTRLGQNGEVAECSYQDNLHWGLLRAGGKVSTGAPLFPRIEESE